MKSFQLTDLTVSSQVTLQDIDGDLFRLQYFLQAAKNTQIFVLEAHAQITPPAGCTVRYTSCYKDLKQLTDDSTVLMVSKVEHERSLDVV